MTQYKGTPVPLGLGAQHRVFLETLQEHLIRAAERGSGSGGSGGGPGKASGNARILFERIHAGGTISTFPLETEGTILVLTFAASPTVVPSSTLKLPHSFTPVHEHETLTLVSEGIAWREIARGSSAFPTFFPAARVGAIPDTGDDMTSQIQDAFDLAPVGSTVFFEPGTYLVSGSLSCTRQLSVWAYGAIFDFQTTDLSGSGYALQYGNQEAAVADRVERKSFQGLKIQRTYGTTVASLLYEGFRWLALLECNVQDVEAVGFESGHRPVGGLGVSIGNVHNNYVNLKTFDCRYGIDIADSGASAPNGHSNENNYFGGRMHLSSAITDESPTPHPGNCHAIRIRYLGSHIPNNNRFYGVSMETNWGRKIYCEGIENYWYGCRYENQNGTCDIEFYDPASAGQTGSRNMILEGDELHDCTIQPPGGNGSNFDGSGRTVNLNKIMSNTNWFIRAGSGSSTDAGVQFSTGTETNDSLQIRGTDQAYSIGLQADDTASYAGALTFRDPTTGAIIYKLRLRHNLTPDQIVITNASGQDIGSIYLNGTNFTLANLRANTSDRGVVDIIGGNNDGDPGDDLVPALRVRNTVLSDHLAQLISTAGQAMRLGLVAEEGGGRLGAIVGFSGAAGAEVERNRIHLSSSSPFPWVVQHRLTVGEGAVINEDGLDSDTRIEGDTDANAFFLDASAAGGSVGIGTATPGAKLEVQGTVNFESTATDAFLVEGPSGEAFRVDTDNEFINSGLVHRFEAIAQVREGFSVGITTVSSTPYTLLREDTYLSCDPSGGAITINLMTLASLGDYPMAVWFKNQAGSGNNVTLDAPGAETIDGAGTLVLAPGEAAFLVGDPAKTDWEIAGRV